MKRKLHIEQVIKHGIFLLLPVRVFLQRFTQLIVTYLYVVQFIVLFSLLLQPQLFFLQLREFPPCRHGLFVAKRNVALVCISLV